MATSCNFIFFIIVTVTFGSKFSPLSVNMVLFTGNGSDISCYFEVDAHFHNVLFK